MMRWFAVLSLSGLLAGCAGLGGLFGDEDNVEPPAPLQPLEEAVPVDVLWSKDIGVGSDKQRVNLVPAVVGEVVYVADRRGRVFAVDANAGEVIWKVNVDRPLAAGPGVGEGLLLLGTSDGDVLALATEDGSQQWSVRLTSEVLAVPKVDRGVVVARSVDGKIFGLRAEDGSILWHSDRSVPVLTLRGMGSPLLVDGMVLVGFANGKLAALSLQDGGELWETSISIPRGRSELDRLVDVDSDLVLHRGMVYAASFQGEVAAIIQDTGGVIWRREVSSYTGLAVDYAQVYVTDSESHLLALDQRSGAALWKQDALHARAVTGPSVQRDYVVVGDLEGYVHWLKRDDGQLIARVRIGKESVTHAPIIHGEVVYVYGDKGTLTALRLSPSV